MNLTRSKHTQIGHPVFLPFAVSVSVYVQHVYNTVSLKVLRKVYFIMKRKTSYPFCLCVLLTLFFDSALPFCHMLSAPSATTTAPSTSLKSHRCILNYLRLIASSLQGEKVIRK